MKKNNLPPAGESSEEVSEEKKLSLLDAFEKAIGQPFKVLFMWDIAKAVDRKKQIVIGEKGEYPVEWCRLKQEQPVQLRKEKPLIA